MRTLMALLILLALFSPQALAVVDPDPNGIGVYFDQDANIYEMDMAPSTPFYTYVVLTNPTAQEIHGYEFSYRLSVPPGMEGALFRLGMVFPPHFVGIPPLPEYDIFEDEIFMHFSFLPLPGGPAVVLGYFYFMVLWPDVEIEFFLGPTSFGDLVFLTEDGPVTMYVSSGDPDLPVAMINKTGVVPTTETSFGSLKALYH